MLNMSSGTAVDKGMKPKTTLAVLATAALVAFPAGAMGKDGSGGNGKGKDGDAAAAGQKAPGKPKKAKTDTYEFKGLVVAVGEGTVQVEVTAGNSRGRKLKGQTLTFDVTKAKLKVADVNKDGKRDLADVAAGDRVNVQAKLPRGAVDTSQALPARHFVDKGPVPAPEAPADLKEPEAPEAPPAA
jgi:hypothetical protein